jgi:phosphatidate cytidylyltransferase
MLKTRIITALILMAVFIPLLFKSNQIIWSSIMLLLSLLTLQEWAEMFNFSKFGRVFYLFIAAIVGGLVILGIKYLGFHYFFNHALTVFALFSFFWLIIVPIWMKRKWVIHHKIAVGLLGYWLIFPLWFALICAKVADPKLLLLLLATIWLADSAAYFAGKNFGKYKLAPTISPGKTWEGVLGALIGTSLLALVLYIAFDVDYMIFPLLWIVTILGVIGDLFESLMKRQANIKDSGRLLPGHGGILDRIDGIISSLPVAICLLYFYHFFVPNL